jgi:hypothetical protein
MGKRTHAGWVLGALLLVAARASAQDPASPDRVAELEKKVRELEERLRKVEPAAPVGSATPTTKVGAPALPEKATSPEEVPKGPPPRKKAPVTPADPEGLRGAPGPVIRPPPTELTVLEAVFSATERLRLYGAIDASYFWKIQDPKIIQDGIQLSTTTPDHDTFMVTWAKMGVTRQLTDENEWDVGFAFDLAYGRLVQTTLSVDPKFLFNSAINSQNAFVDLKLPTPWNPVEVRFGRFPSWIGIEAIDPMLNPNFSHSFFFRNTPFTTTGFSASTELGAGFRYTQFVVNGWDVVIDNNKSKSLGGQLSWINDDPYLAIAFNWIWGPEQPDNTRDDTYWLELGATFKPLDGTEVRASLHYGQAEHGTATGNGTSKFGGVLLIARQEFYEVEPGFRRFAFALRGEYFRDQGGHFSVGHFSVNDQTLAEVTATFQLRFSRLASVRLEYRHDYSTAKPFLGGNNDLVHNQDTIGVDVNFQF